MAHAREWVATDGPVKVELIHEDDGRGHHHALRHVQDVEPILDDNARLRGHQQVGTPKLGAKLAARVPETIYYLSWPTEFELKHGVHPKHPDLRLIPAAQHSSTRKEIDRQWRKFVIGKLNDRNYSKLRVDEGRL